MDVMTFNLKPEAYTLWAKYVGDSMIIAFALTKEVRDWLRQDCPGDDWYELILSPIDPIDTGIADRDYELMVRVYDSAPSNFDHGTLFRFKWGV